MKNKRSKSEIITTVAMVVIAVLCLASVVFVFYRAATAKPNSSVTSTSEIEQVDPGTESTETVTLHEKEYTINVPGTIDLKDYDETKYINSDGRYTFNTRDYIENQEITLPEFNGKKEEYTPTEEAILEEIDKLLKNNSEFIEYEDEEHQIVEGDTVVVNYSAYYNGVEMPSIADTEASLVVGSENYIPGFEEALIGHKKGEEFSCDVTFPETYTSDGTVDGDVSTAEDADGNEVTLTGNTFEFKIEVVKVGNEQIPELTDEWVAKNVGESSELPINSIEDLKSYYNTMLYYSALISDVNTYVVDEVMPTIEFKDIPKELIEFIISSGLYQYYQYGESMGMTLDTTLYTYTGNNVHDFIVENLESIAEQAIQLMAWDLVYDEVLKLGAANVADEEQFKTLMNEIVCVELTDEELTKILAANGTEYSKNYATQYAIADFLVKE